MKKFLLTLLTLFMAGSLCAEEYFYMDNIQVTKNFLAQSGAKKRRADIPVKASFDARVNGWQVDLTLPTGVTLRNGVEGADMTIHTLDAVGNDKNIPVTLSSNLENCRFIGANSGAGYYYPEGSDPDEDDPVTCGAAKWEPGVYEQMFVITLEFDQDFTGGEITVTTRTSAGADPRGNITDANADPRIKTCTVTVVDDETLTLDPAEKEATVGEAIDVTVTCADDATIAYSGASVTTTDNGFEITSDEVGEFTVTATATFGVKDETFGYTVRNGVNYVYLPITAEGTYTFTEEVIPLTVTVDPEEASAITGKTIAVAVEANKDGATFSYAVEPATGATVTATDDGFEITAETAGEYKVTVTATVGEETATVEGIYTFVEPLAVTLNPDEASAIIGENIAVAVEANKDGATFSYVCEGATVTETEDGFEITATEAGEYTVTVTATLDGETATAEGTYTFAVPLAVTLNPATGNAITGEKIAVAVEANKDGATFSYACEGATVTETEDGFEITATEAGTYTVTVTATLDGETATAEGTYTFAVPLAVTLNPATGNAKVDQEIAVTVEANKDGATFSYACEGATVTATDDGFKITATVEGTYKVTVTATLDGETAEAEGTYTFSAITYAPEPELNWDADNYTMTVVVPEGYSVVVTVNGTEETITETKEYVYEQTEEDQEIAFTAYTVKKTEDNNSAVVEKNVTVPALDELEGDITIGDVNQENGQFTVEYDGDEDVTLTVTVKDETGEETTLEPDDEGNYTLPAEGTYDITVTATADGYKPMTETAEDVNWTKPTADPVITYTNENGVLTVTATGTDASTVTLTVGDQTATGEGSVSIEVEYNEAEGIEVTATATAKEENRPVSNEVTEEIKIDAIAVTPTPTINVTRDESFYYVKATGNGEVKLYIDGEEIVLRADSPEAKLAREEDDYTVTATATAKEEGKLISETATKDVLVKALVEQPEQPEITITPTTDPETNDVLSVAIEITPAEGTELPEDAEIWYSIDGKDPVKYNGEFNYAEDGNHTIEAWVVVKDTDANVEPNSIDVEGKKEQASFDIGIGTNVNELVNGKQIAGVRYFNMAGQEMQEANGITIVVTTYTDGTTSTVKVMK